jgi:hypothetical protein
MGPTRPHRTATPHRDSPALIDRFRTRQRTVPLDARDEVAIAGFGCATDGGDQQIVVICPPCHLIVVMQ